MVRTTFLIVLFVHILFVGVQAQKDLFVSAEGGFSVNLPAKLAVESATDIPDTKPGGKQFRWMFENKLSAFVVAYSDSLWAKKGEEAFRVNKAAEGLIEAFEAKGGKLISKESIMLGRHQGVEVRYRKPDALVITRYYVVEARIYFIMGLWMPGHKSSSNETEILKILNSFAIKD